MAATVTRPRIDLLSPAFYGDLEARFLSEVFGDLSNLNSNTGQLFSGRVKVDGGV